MLPSRISEKKSGLLSRSGKKSSLDDDFFIKLAQEVDKEEETSDVSEADPMVLLESMKDTEDMDADLFSSKRKTSSSTPATVGARVSEDGDPRLGRKLRGPETGSRAQPPKRDIVTFDDEEDDLMDALGFGESPKSKTGMSADQGLSNTEPPLAVERRLDEILFRGRSPQPERPSSEEKHLLAEQNLVSKDPGAVEEDFTFGSYQPTLASSLEGRQSRRPSVRFSTEDVDGSSPERKRPSASAAADWLGLKRNEPEVKAEQLSPTQDSPNPCSPCTARPTGSSPLPGPKPSENTAYPETDDLAVGLAGHPRMGEDDWLAEALTRKKTQAAARPKERGAGRTDHLRAGEKLHLDSLLSKHSSPALRKKSDETPTQPQPSISPMPLEIPHGMAAPPRHSHPLKEDQPELLAELGLGCIESSMETETLCAQRDDTEQKSRELTSHATLLQLETQISTIQRERDQAQALLQTISHRYTQDAELMESKHRASVKLLEEALREQKVQRQQERDELTERLAAVTQRVEQERSQYQCRLSNMQHDKDAEVKRLQELQRMSILEMQRDHEEQVQRLRRLKDDEINTVTSSTSHTRSVSVVMEQMDHISRRLGDLSSRMESSQEHTSQGLEQGAQQRNEQLRVLQEHLVQQERGMREERSRLKEVIAKMEGQLAEQQRQLEKERWRAAADQAKAESAHRALEEERRSLTQHISMEREELERAKSALLEEQQSVMLHCAEERRKMGAEWARFHVQEKLRQEWAERESRLVLERDASREGSIITMAQEQADLRLRASEVRLREEALSREKEALKEQREELAQERERLNVAALRLKTRALELEGFSKLASEKYDDGERALQEARRVEMEHSTRLHTIHTQMEKLHLQERNLHQEQMKITSHRREVEDLRQGFPITSLPLPSAPLLPDFAPWIGSVQLASTIMAPLPHSPGITEMQARLALIRNTAEKDQDFLRDEQFFLETLKKAPNNSTLHTA